MQIFGIFVKLFIFRGIISACFVYFFVFFEYFLIFFILYLKKSANGVILTRY